MSKIVNESLKRKPRQSGFTLVEIMTVMVIMLVLMGLLVSTGMIARPMGGRQGAINQIMQVLDEARMRAIENGTTVYVGFADASYPDPGMRFRSYMLFRACTPDEIAAMKTPPPADYRMALTEWETLPTGFYLDPGATKSLLQDNSADVSVSGLPGQPPSLYVVAFGPLGQVILPADQPPRLAVTEATYQGSGNELTQLSYSNGSRFYIQVNPLTGRVQCKEGVIN